MQDASHVLIAVTSHTLSIVPGCLLPGVSAHVIRWQHLRTHNATDDANHLRDTLRADILRVTK